MRDEIIGAQEEAHRLHELRQGAVTELSRLRYAEEELEQVDMTYHANNHRKLCNFCTNQLTVFAVASISHGYFAPVLESDV